MITKAQLNALARTLSLTASPSTSLPGVVMIRVTPDLSTLSLQQTDPGQTVTALLKFVRFADAGLSGLGTWSATITETQLAGNVATYTFSEAPGLPQVGQTVSITGCVALIYNIIATISSVPDSTHFTVAITHADIPLAGGQSGYAIADKIDIITFLAGNLLGGQPMPAIQIALPGPGLSGAQLPPSSITTTGPITGPGGLTATITSPTVAANPALPSLSDDSGLPIAQRLHDLLAGVPGIVAHVEQRVTAAVSAPVTISVDWKLMGGNNGQQLAGNDSLLNFLPLPVFGRLGAPLGSARFAIGASVTLSAGGISSDLVILPPVTFSVPQIGVPLLAALFTWRSYGTQSSSGDTNPDDDSTLLMIPSDSPVSDLSSITNALNRLVYILQGLASTFGGSLTGIALDPAINNATMVASNLTSAVAGISALINALNYTLSGHADFKPVVIARAASAAAGPLGGIADISIFIFDSEFFWSYDRYHDHAKSALLVGPPGSVIEMDHDSNFKGSNGQITMTTVPIATAMGALFVGIRDFSNVLETTDPSGANVQTTGSQLLYEHTQSMKFLP